MRVFQSTYKDKKGRTRTTKTWYVEFRDHLEMPHRVSGFADRKATEALGRNIEKLAWSKAGGQALDPVLTKWVEGLSPKLRKTLRRFGLLDAARVAALEPLTKHVDGEADAEGRAVFLGFRQALAAKGTSAKQVDLVAGRAKRVIEGCGFVFWSDISASKVMSYLDGLRADRTDDKDKVKPGVSAQTFNFYLAALKQFCKWMVKDGRASESPVAHLDGLNVKTDRRHDRRALDVEEIRWLLDTTRSAPERYGMSGPERATLYRLAVETGLRAGELASLTRASFALNGERATVTVDAAYSKRRRVDVLPLRPDTAADLRDFLACKLPDAAAFNMPPNYDTADMLRADLTDARTAWLEDATSPQEHEKREKSAFLSDLDAAGRVIDFHALRHTAGSLLASAGVHPKVAQTLMRHSDINLTMSRYTHVFRGQESDAVAALPDLDAVPAKQSAKATGTDHATAQAAQDATGHPRASDHAQARPMDHPRPDNDGRKASKKNSASYLAREGSLSPAASRDVAQKAGAPDSDKALVNTGETAYSQGENEASARSSTGQSSGLLNRRLEVRVLPGALRHRAPCGSMGTSPGSPACRRGLSRCTPKVVRDFRVATASGPLRQLRTPP